MSTEEIIYKLVILFLAPAVLVRNIVSLIVLKNPLTLWKQFVIVLMILVTSIELYLFIQDGKLGWAVGAILLGTIIASVFFMLFPKVAGDM